jgi:Mu-like prophage I protein
LPLPNEHSARVRQPDEFDPDSFRRTKLPGTTVEIISGKLKGAAGADDPMVVQTYRFPVKDFTADEARQWLKDNDVTVESFEPAAEKRDASRGTVRSQPVRLEEAGDAAANRPRWQHVCTAGKYEGYDDGRSPFELTRATFEEMRDNLRSMPEYHRGPDGVGDADCVPWDFHHATDANPALVSVVGAPAQGWVRDLDVRTGNDGVAQLWALTRWLPTAAQYIREGAYKWASISALLDAVDQKSGKRVGAVLTSVAITNTPFVQGMQQLAASRLGGWMEPAATPIEAVGRMKELLGLKETDDVGAVMAEVARMRQWLDLGTVPLGVDMEGIVGAMRRLLGLPALTIAATVLDEIGKLTVALLEEQAAAQRSEPGAQPASMTEGASDMDLLKTLSKELGVREGDAEVVAAVKDSVTLRANLKQATGAAKDTTEVLTADVVALAADRKDLLSLRKAIGAPATQEDAVARVTVLLEAETKLKALEPEHAAMKARLAEQDKAKAEADVQEVIASRKLPDEVRDALLELRLSKPEQFTAKFPPLGDRAALTRPGVAAAAAPPAPGTAGPGDGPVIDLSAIKGRNATHRLMQWVRANEAPMAQAADEVVWRRACELRSTGRVVGQ